MRQVASGVFELSLGPVSNAFLVTGDVPALVDCGLPGNTRRILAATAGVGVAAQDLGCIAITHHHVDHIGSLAAVVRATAAEVYAPVLEAPILEGTEPAPPLVGRSVASRVMLALSARLGPKGAAPATVQHHLEDGEAVGDTGLVAVATPGHTVGHMSFLHEGSGTLFVGDAAANMFGRLGKPVGGHDEDLDATVASIARLSSLDFEVACFGHGGAIVGGAQARFRELAEKVRAG